jgi:hypothetical protein
VTSKYPTSFNTAILTGFSTNSTGQPNFTTGLNLALASQNQPYRFTSLSNGYLVSSSAISNQIAFFHAPNFDVAILNLAEATKGTVTFGELFSLESVIAPASNFTSSVAVVNGAEDLPFCTGNCSYPTNLAQAVFSTLYPAAKITGAYLAPLTGPWSQSSLLGCGGVPLHPRFHLEQHLSVVYDLRMDAKTEGLYCYL